MKFPAMCSDSAADAEILVDLIAAAAIGTRVPLVQKDSRMMKGFDRPVPVFIVDVSTAPRVI